MQALDWNPLTLLLISLSSFSYHEIKNNNLIPPPLLILLCFDLIKK